MPQTESRKRRRVLFTTFCTRCNAPAMSLALHTPTPRPPPRGYAAYGAYAARSAYAEGA